MYQFKLKGKTKNAANTNISQKWRALKIGFKDAVTPNVTSPAVEAAAQGVGVAERHLDAFYAESFKHSNDRDFVAVDDHAFWIQHEYIHRQPLGRHPERMT